MSPRWVRFDVEKARRDGFRCRFCLRLVRIVRRARMQIDIEFLGLARLVTGERELTLRVEEGTTYRDLVRLLAAKYPQLIGQVIRPDRATLQEPNIFNLNARRMIQAKQMDESLQGSDRIILMSMSAGG